jgi:type II secretory pathway pseudopilin PulG
MKLFSRRARAADLASDDDVGFTLIEVIVALGLILFVMTASVTFFVNSTRTSSTLQVKIAAISLADAAMETARSYSPASAMLANRDITRATAQWTSLPAAASASTSLSTVAYDSTATGSTVPSIPFSTTDATTKVNNLQYTVSTAIGQCYMSALTGAVCSSANIGNAGATLMYRVIVDVHWAAKVGEVCPSSGCDYVVVTLRDGTLTSKEPLFNSNNQLPS